jgi:hypothetical protein
MLIYLVGVCRELWILAFQSYTNKVWPGFIQPSLADDQSSAIELRQSSKKQQLSPDIHFIHELRMHNSSLTGYTC